MPHIDREGVLTATQVLSATIPKPALLPWAVKLAVEELAETLQQHAFDHHGTVLDARAVEDLKARAKSAHARASTAARDVGSAVHALIDIAIGAGLGEPPAELPPDEWVAIDGDGRARVERLFGLWGQWIEKAGLTPIMHEVDLYEPGASLAGSCDLVAKCADGKLAVVDWKTSKGVYAESWFQLGIYALLLERRGIIVERLMVVVINDEGVTAETSDRVDEAKRCAQALFESASWLVKEKDPWKKRK